MQESARIVCRLIFALGLALSLAACSSIGGGPAPYSNTMEAPLQATARYPLTPTFTALVVPAYRAGRETELANLAKLECSGRSFCAVGFWREDASAPRKLKMSPSQVAARSAQFVFSPIAGSSRSLWNCRETTSIAGQCL